MRPASRGCYQVRQTTAGPARVRHRGPGDRRGAGSVDADQRGGPMADADAPAAGRSRLRQMGRALAGRNYRLFFAGQGVSLVGTWMTRLATGWLVLRLA